MRFYDSVRRCTAILFGGIMNALTFVLVKVGEVVKWWLIV